MPWETRNGQKYYYRKKRIGRRVISEYVGRGPFADALAQVDEFDRERQASERQACRQELAQYEEIENDLDQMEGYARLFERAAFLLAGYHPHKGQWRRRRD